MKKWKIGIWCGWALFPFALAGSRENKRQKIKPNLFYSSKILYLCIPIILKNRKIIK